jgi:hypothetical protein
MAWGRMQHLALAKVCMLRCITSREARRDHSPGPFFWLFREAIVANLLTRFFGADSECGSR